MTTQKIEILKNQKLPRPNIRSGRNLIYPFDRLEVGDCFSIKVPAGLEARQLQARLSTCARSFSKRHGTTRNPLVFKTRVLREGKKRSKVAVFRTR